MEPVTDYIKMMEMLSQPAFAVRNGLIIGWNSTAQLFRLQEGQAVSELLLNGQEEYAALKEGCLGLQLKLNGMACAASVSRLGDADIFQLTTPGVPDEIKAMNLMSSQMRKSIYIMSIIANRADKSDKFRAEFQHEVNRMQRMLNNASNAARYLSGGAAPYMDMDACAILQEVLEESAALLEKAGLTLEYTLPAHPVFLSLDEESLRQAMYNLIGNAGKFSPQGGTVRVKVTANSKYLSIRISDEGEGLPPKELSGVFNRYAREPIMEDWRTNLGLGLPLARAMAIAHGGTVLVESPAGSGLRVLMTLERKVGKSLRRPTPIPVILSRSEGIIMLSDALPQEVYN